MASAWSLAESSDDDLNGVESLFRERDGRHYHTSTVTVQRSLLARMNKLALSYKHDE
jgi:hypothetical protein